MAAPANDAHSENGICVEVKDVWKIFGHEPKKLLKSDLKDASKDEILDKANCVLGLRNISFSVQRGEFFVLMGLSGSGKSTLIRCLIRLIEPTTGKILINGQDVCAYAKDKLINLRRHVTGMVFQHFGLLPHYTVLDNVAYPLKVRGMPKEKRYSVAEQAIETVGLKGWESYLPSALSGGMQQRVGLARALAIDPEILLMDEPFSGLDPLIRREMQDELVELQDKVQKTIVFVTHDLHEALKLGGRIAIMRDGEIIQVGSPEDVITAPADDYVQQFVQDASPAKVLTAGTIMEEPDLLLYEWQTPKVARTLLGRSKQDDAFVLSKDRKVLGLVTLDTLRELEQRGMTTLKEGLITGLPTCTPEMIIEELFPLATSTKFPIAVLDGKARFMGDIRNRRIIESMIQDTGEKVLS
ncbi:MAG: glycine betaine/L-proline ABC transporter ATP-binding protein [Desulfobacteraceae bacterium]